MEAELTASVREISGIGQQRARALGKLGIETLGQLIGWFPRKYDDRTSIRRIADLVPGAVSYTHLDVYKRQVHQRHGGNGRLPHLR